MNQGRKQAVIAVLFAFLLAFVAIYGTRDRWTKTWQRWNSSSSTASGSNPQQSLARYGFHLVEKSKDAHVDFRHESPTLDKRLDHIMPIVASMGAGVSVCDFDA